MFSLWFVSQDKALAEKLLSPLEIAGFRLVHFLQPPASLVETTPSLLLLDLAPPPSPGVRELMEECRQGGLPVLLVLTAEELRGKDLTLGDDFILKPVSPPELIARLRQLLWRTRGLDSQKVLRRGELVMDLERYEVWVSGRQVTLTFREFELLRLLASNPGRVYSREELLDRVWGDDYLGGTRTVDVHIRRLRSKLEDAQHTFLDTIWNVGYRFKG